MNVDEYLGLAACFRENEGWESSGVIDLDFQPSFLSIEKLGHPQASIYFVIVTPLVARH